MTTAIDIAFARNLSSPPILPLSTHAPQTTHSYPVTYILRATSTRCPTSATLPTCGAGCRLSRTACVFRQVESNDVPPLTHPLPLAGLRGDFTWSLLFEREFYAALAREGFLPIASTLGDGLLVLMPKLHEVPSPTQPLPRPSPASPGTQLSQRAGGA